MVNYNYGIKYSSQIDLEHQMEKIRNILKKPSIINLLKSNDILSVYNAVHSMNYLRSVSDLTDFFIINNIDFLKYTDEIPIECFADTNLSYIDIPSHIKIIGYEAFFQTDLEEITIPGNVKIIGENAFDGCNELRKIVMEEGVEIIKDHAFRYCGQLEIVYFPNSIKDIGQNIFQASGVENFTVICDEGSYAQEWCENNGGININIITN